MTIGRALHGNAAILRVFFFLFGHNFAGLNYQPVVHSIAAVCNGLNGCETKDGFLTYPQATSPMGDSIDR
jgi:hypothetical protein